MLFYNLEIKGHLFDQKSMMKLILYLQKKKFDFQITTINNEHAKDKKTKAVI